MRTAWPMVLGGLLLTHSGSSMGSDGGAVDGSRPLSHAQAQAVASQEVAKVFDAHQTSVLNCYRQMLHRRAKSQGLIQIAFTIKADGTVANPTVFKDEIGDDELGRCLIDLVQKWSFPVHPEGRPIQLAWPFRFGVN